MEEILQVLFVCSGNTCRSVMAEAFFRRLWEKEGPGQVKIKVASAGLHTAGGQPASAEARKLLKSAGLSAAEHRSRPLTAALLAEADYIFTMTAVHKEFIAGRFPAFKHKVWTLGEFGGTAEDIDDPYGGGEEAYRRAAAQITQALEGVLEHLGQNKGKAK